MTKSLRVDAAPMLVMPFLAPFGAPFFSTAIDAVNPQLAVDHGHVVLAHLAGTDRVVDGVGAFAQDLDQLFIAVQAGAVEVAQAEAGHRCLGDDLAGHAVPLEQGLDVVVVVQQAHAADALGAQHADVTAEAVAPVQLTVVVIDRADHRVQLDIRSSEGRVGLQECTGFGAVAGQRAATVAQVIIGRLAHLQAARQGHAKQRGIAALVAQHHIGVIAQVLAHPRQLMPDGDTLGFELGSRADPREHQQMRAAEGPCGQQHFLARLQVYPSSLDQRLHASGAFALEHDAFDMGVGQHREVTALAHRFQECGGRAPAPAIADGHVVIADTLLPGTVEVFVENVSCTQGRLDEGFGDDMAMRGADVKLAFAAVVVVVTAMVHLALAKVGQHIVERPAFVTQRVPVVVIVVMAADVDHAIDRAAAAQHLAARLVAMATAQASLRSGLERPVDMPCRQDRGHADGGVDQRRAVFRARFDQAHGDAGVGAQAIGKDAAGGACAYDQRRRAGGLAVPGGVLVDETGNVALRRLGLRQGGDHLEHMGQALPDLQVNRHAGRRGLGGGAHRVIQQHLGAAYLEQQRRQAIEAAEQRRYCRLPVGFGRGIEAANADGEGRGEDRIMARIVQGTRAAEGEQRKRQVATGGVAGDDDVAGLEALSLQPAVGVERFVKRGWEWVLGGQAVVQHQCPGLQWPAPARDHRGVDLRGVGNEGAAMDVQQYPFRPAMGRRQPLGGDAIAVHVGAVYIGRECLGRLAIEPFELPAQLADVDAQAMAGLHQQAQGQVEQAVLPAALGWVDFAGMKLRVHDTTSCWLGVGQW
ncbi:hypothetical protein WR25_15959 [Diploscapter pachys]|uniref:Uncharacterized protein n=1 Tax=Diploscapter pachys TaxID=2018661 RepID=A0A2A2KEV0_9BILA|nr:hypothetical protein WR25_15959 [Diploscapter pachys]